MARADALRKAAALRPVVQNVRVTMHDGHTGRAFDARGAVAVRRDDAVRMILLGPGGTTALDVWLTRDDYRLVVPAIGLTRRPPRPLAHPAAHVAAPASAPDAPPPIGFLRWWFLAPFEGRPIAAMRDPASAAPAIVLRERDGATVVMHESGSSLTLERTPAASDGASHGAPRHERVRIEGDPFAEGARITYEDPAIGVRVDVVVEGVSTDPPDPEAFADPDAPSGSVPPPVR